MTDPIVSMDIYLTQASRELTQLADKADDAFGRDRLAELIVDLAEKNTEDLAPVNTAILKGQGALISIDYTHALNVTADAAERAPAGSKLELELIERWEDLMTIHNGDLRAEIFPFAEAVFKDSNKDGLKATAAEQVVALSLFAANDSAQVAHIKAAVQAAQTFAFQTENIDLANTAGSRLTELNKALQFASPAYDRK